MTFCKPVAIINGYTITKKQEKYSSVVRYEVSAPVGPDPSMHKVYGEYSTKSSAYRYARTH